MIFLSKYLSRAKESRNKENKEINIEGISVNKAKKVIYFLFALEPLTSTSIFKEALTSLSTNGYYKFDLTQPLGLGTKLAKTYVERILVGQPGITYKYLGSRMFAYPWDYQSQSSTNYTVQIKKMNDALKVISEKKLGVLIIINKKKQIKGIITDGDIKRALQKNTNLHKLIVNVSKDITLILFLLNFRSLNKEFFIIESLSSIEK